MGCVKILVIGIVFVLLMITFIRWFEQTAEAVDRGWWSKLVLLLVCPFVVWFFPARVGTGRSIPVPHHEPVRGFGSVPKSRGEVQPGPGGGADLPAPGFRLDEPPPGTPREFLGLPTVPPLKPKPSSDPEKIAKLKEKMRQQGMLPPEGE